jgi:L-idonate 5-dehydrogenase
LPPNAIDKPELILPMRAIVIHAAKDLRLDPVEVGRPGPGEVRISLERGGICGSDLHYYHEGRIGTIVLRQPMVLGHEVAGLIETVGEGVGGLARGDRVAVSPSRPCRTCRYCQEGRQMHCLNMRFYGSAMPFPHVHGAFQQAIVADAAQCFPVPKSLTAGEAAMCEPLAVCLHAVRRAGSLFGRRVLVTGCGPIGALCVAAARHAGAAEIVATDVTDTPFALVRKLGADRCIDVAKDAAALAAYGRDKGQFDALLECSGNERALVGAFDVLRPMAVIVQVGLGGSFTLPINVVVAKEFELRGTFRFHEEFGLAAGLIGSRAIDVRPLITATVPFEKAVEAFELASDRTKSMKVQLAFA